MFRTTAKDLRQIIQKADGNHVPRQSKDAVDFTLERMKERAGDTLLPMEQRESVIVHWVPADDIGRFIPAELAAKKPLRLAQLAEPAVAQRYATELGRLGFTVSPAKFTHPDDVVFDYLVISCAEVQG